jgi:hypothetical protein
MAYPRWLAIPILAVVILTSVVGSARAQGGNSLYFAETGHRLSGEFLNYFSNTIKADLLYGDPITEAIFDPLTGYTVQYFERARFELQQAGEMASEVRVSPLGWLLYEPGAEVKFNRGTAACRSFAAQGFTVCYSFLDYFKANGGVESFGNPISNLENHEGVYVQYFERARLEWHPEMPAGRRVVLSNLGKMYFDQHVNDPDLLRPIPYDSSTQPGPRLTVRTFVARPVTGPEDRQTVYVVVHDQFLRPVVGAGVALYVNYPDGTSEHFSPGVTDADGVSQVEFAVRNQPADSVIRLNAEVSTENSHGDDEAAWFRVWW